MVLPRPTGWLRPCVERCPPPAASSPRATRMAPFSQTRRPRPSSPGSAASPPRQPRPATRPRPARGRWGDPRPGPRESVGTPGPTALQATGRVVGRSVAPGIRFDRGSGRGAGPF